MKYLEKIGHKLSKADIIELQQKAIEKNDRLVTIKLLEMHNQPMLRHGILSNNPSIVLILLRNDFKNIEITKLQADNSSYLHLAAKVKNNKILRVLLKWMKEHQILSKFIDLQNKDGNTPLHLAAKINNLEGVKALLEYGANKMLKNNKYQLAKNIASRFEIVILLKSK